MNEQELFETWRPAWQGTDESLRGFLRQMLGMVGEWNGVLDELRGGNRSRFVDELIAYQSEVKELDLQSYAHLDADVLGVMTDEG